MTGSVVAPVDIAAAAPAPDDRPFGLAVLIAVFTAAAMLIVGDDIVDRQAVAGHIAVTATVCSVAILLRRRTRTWGAALAGALLITLALAVIPLGAAVYLIAIGTAAAALAVARPRRSPDAALVPILALLLAAVVFAETDTPYGSFLMDARQPTAAMHTDTVQHMAVSNMLLHEHRLSLGVHGTMPLRYHAFSHVVYGAIARLLRVPVASSYALATSLVFVPLLFGMILAWTGELRPLVSWRAFGGAALLLLSFLVGFTGRPFLESCTLWQPYFYSESYLLGLVLFVAFLSSVHVARPAVLTTALFLVLVTTTKASIGAIGGVLLAVRQWQDFRRGETTPLRAMVLLGVTGVAASAALAGFAPQGNQGQLAFLTFVDSYLTSSCLIAGSSFASRVAAFVAVHYFFLWIAVAAWLLTRERFLPPLLQLAGAAAVVGFLPLSMQIPAGGAFYFSNVATFVALPLVMSCAAWLEVGGRRQRGVAVALLVAGLAGVAVSGTRFVARRIESVAASAAGLPGESTVTPYVHQLLAIGARPHDQRLLVYIPKSEDRYWKAPVPDCTRMPVLIPALSNRPALFGLPANDCRLAIGRDYTGYEAQFDPASRPEISRGVLCAETRRLGFAGYIEVRRAGETTVSCAAPQGG